MNKRRFTTAFIGLGFFVTALTAGLRMANAAPPPRQCPLPSLAAVGFAPDQVVRREARCAPAEEGNETLIKYTLLFVFCTLALPALSIYAAGRHYATEGAQSRPTP